MSTKKQCYFKCKFEGLLFTFPPVTYTSYDKYCKWKSVLRKEDQEKDDNFIIHNFKFCKNHFESMYITASNHLTRNAVPTLNIGTSSEQEQLLCTFIEENPTLIMEFTASCDLKKIEAKWMGFKPYLNALGPARSFDAWAKYLLDVMTHLKTKKVEWKKQPYSSSPNTAVVANTKDFTALELKILELQSKPIMAQSSPDHIESLFEEEYKNNTVDSDSSDTSSDIVTYTLNGKIGGNEPLLQSAEIAPYEATQQRFKCHSNIEVHDKFDGFGREVAQELRNMPVKIAFETQRLLLSVLRNKQNRLLNGSFIE